MTSQNVLEGSKDNDQKLIHLESMGFDSVTSG